MLQASSRNTLSLLSPASFVSSLASSQFLCPLFFALCSPSSSPKVACTAKAAKKFCETKYRLTMNPFSNTLSALFDYYRFAVPDQATSPATALNQQHQTLPILHSGMTNAVSYAAAATTASGHDPKDVTLAGDQPGPAPKPPQCSNTPVPSSSCASIVSDPCHIDQSDASSPRFALTASAPQDTLAADSSVDAAAAGSPSSGEVAATAPAPADLQASLLLQPFAASTVAPACTSPLDMLIAALEPAPANHAFSSECSTAANAYQSAPNSATAMWSPDGVGQANYAPFPWAAAQSAQPIGVPLPAVIRRASDGALLGGYQLSRPQDELVGSSYSGISRDSMRKSSHPAGIKRPYTDFDNLLSAADMYANGQVGDPVHSPNKQPRLQPPLQPQPPSLVGNLQYAEDSATSPYASAAMPQATAAVDSVTAAAAAAAAAASMAYSAAFPYSTKRSTVPVPVPDPTAHLQYQDMCFGSLPAPPVSMAPPHIPQQQPPPPPLAHPHTYPHVAPPHMPPPMHMSFHMGSNDTGAHPLPASYLFGSSGGPAMAHPQHHPLPDFLATTPIPAIPGVTASPKETPRRVSIPDLTPTAEEERIGAKARPRRQKLRFHDDLYTPMWVRNNGQQKEGFCDTCTPGKWLQLKNSAYWYHKQFFHGISSVSGRPFMRPLQARHFDADIIEGLCHQCRQWVPIANAKRRNSVLWFRHAHKCHVYHKPKPDNETDGSDVGIPAVGAPASSGSTESVPYLPSPNTPLPTQPYAGTTVAADNGGDGGQ